MVSTRRSWWQSWPESAPASDIRTRMLEIVRAEHVRNRVGAVAVAVDTRGRVLEVVAGVGAHCATCRCPS